MSFDGEERRKLCESSGCSATDLSYKVDTLISQVNNLSAKVEALDAIFKKIEDIERGFSMLRKVVVGLGTGTAALYGAYEFIKDHWKA